MENVPSYTLALGTGPLHDLADWVEGGILWHTTRPPPNSASPAHTSALGFAMRGRRSVPATGLVDGDLVGS